MHAPDGATGIAPRTPVVLITGATGPAGRAAAASFAADGARLGLGGTDMERLEALAADLGLPSDAWAAAVGDLRDEDAARAAVAAVTDRFGRIDVLLQLVGGWTGGTPVVDLAPDVLAGMLDRHVWSTFHVARAVVPGMTAGGWGRIVAITSTTTTAPGPKMAAYLAAKAAQEAMLRVLAREVWGSGVTVNLLAVRAIDAAKPAGSTTPEEIAGAIRFLCSDDGSAVNGARIALDGRG